MVTLGLGGTLT